MYESGSVRNPTDASWTASSSAFLVGAIARKEGLGGSVDDQWTMNQRKEIINTVNGAL